MKTTIQNINKEIEKIKKEKKIHLKMWLYKKNQSIIFFNGYIWIDLRAQTCQECLCMCNHRDTLRVGSKSGRIWRIWNCHGPWWGPQHFSLRPQSGHRAHGRSRNRGPCWLQDLGEHVNSYMGKKWCNKREQWYLHTTKTSIPIPVGINTTAGGARLHWTSFTPHTVLNVEAQMSLVMFLNKSYSIQFKVVT